MFHVLPVYSKLIMKFQNNFRELNISINTQGKTMQYLMLKLIFLQGAVKDNEIRLNQKLEN